MLDILFDIKAREIVFANNDFATTTNPSVQNGGILLYARVFNNQAIMSGVGMIDVLNSKMDKVAFELNRWQAQAKLDGATLAAWTANNVGPDAIIETDISYE